MQMVVADIGGTNARFALADIDEQASIALSHEIKLPTSDYASLALAWEAYADALDQPLPERASIAIAAPINRDVIKMTNNSWLIRPGKLNDELGVEKVHLLNDFGSVAHAVSVCPTDKLIPLCGPDKGFPEDGVVTVIGPGTGLGVALIVRKNDRTLVCETEGGHVDFAPHDAFEDRLLDILRKHHGRVSVERLACGSALPIIYALLSEESGSSRHYADEKSLWKAAIEGDDPLAGAALERFSLILGGVAGDMALAHGANAVVIAGGLGYRLKDYLPTSGFPLRFADKGRYQGYMSRLPVRLITVPEPGLIGAAAAFVQEYPA